MRGKLRQLFIVVVLSLAVTGFYSERIFAQRTSLGSGFKEWRELHSYAKRYKKYCVRPQKESPGKEQIGNINISGIVKAEKFIGDGSMLTGINGGGSDSVSGLFTANGVVSNGEIKYYNDSDRGNGLENGAQLPIPNDGRLLSLAVNTFLNTLDSNAEVTVRLNGTDTALKITVPAGSISVQITNANINMSAGDLVSLQADTTAAGMGAMRFIATYAFKLE